MKGPDQPAREPWDFDRFVALYDAEAARRNGCRFDRRDVAVPGLRSRYEAGNCQSLVDYAHQCFEYDSFHR
ncbi:MAG: hypothetical protein R3F29_10565 [Planctomycetota bacterium]